MSLSVLLATWRGFGVGIGVRGSSEWENITKRSAGLHGFVWFCEVCKELQDSR